MLALQLTRGRVLQSRWAPVTQSQSLSGETRGLLAGGEGHVHFVLKVLVKATGSGPSSAPECPWLPLCGVTGYSGLFQSLLCLCADCDELLWKVGGISRLGTSAVLWVR